MVGEDLLAWLREFSRNSKAPKGLRRSWRQLFQDVVAVLAGVRATVMMDYCVGQEVEFQVLVDSMKERFSEQLSLSLAVLRFEDCSYICNLPKVINHIQNIVSARSDVHFIGFADTGPCFLDHTGPEVSELRHSLESSLLPALQSAAPSTSGRNEPRHVNIDVAARDIVMPTLNGILLGYPTVYLLRHEGVDKAARALTNGTLLVLKMRVKCKAMPENSDLDPLLACALPAELCPGGISNPIWECWADVTRTTCQRSEWYLPNTFEVYLETSQPGQPVVL